MKTYYRAAITIICALSAFGGPILFLEDRPKLGYLAAGLVAAVMARWLLVGMINLEHHLPMWLRGVLGACAAVLSWAPISLVAVFGVIPHWATSGFNRFDPVWIAGGVLAPATILGAAVWRAARKRLISLDVVMTALYRYSIPLLGLDTLARITDMPKQYPWLILFTGAMFLTLDILVHGVDPIPFRDPNRRLHG